MATADPSIDRKLEGRLFDLLEAKAKIRLGLLNQLRRRSRERKTTLLVTALESGHVDEALAWAIARDVGLPSPHAQSAVDPFASTSLPPPVPVPVSIPAPPAPAPRPPPRAPETETPKAPTPALPTARPVRPPPLPRLSSPHLVPDGGATIPNLMPPEHMEDVPKPRTAPAGRSGEWPPEAVARRRPLDAAETEPPPSQKPEPIAPPLPPLRPEPRPSARPEPVEPEPRIASARIGVEPSENRAASARIGVEPPENRSDAARVEPPEDHAASARPELLGAEPTQPVRPEPLRSLFRPAAPPNTPPPLPRPEPERRATAPFEALPPSPFLSDTTTPRTQTETFGKERRTPRFEEPRPEATQELVAWRQALDAEPELDELDAELEEGSTVTPWRGATVPPATDADDDDELSVLPKAAERYALGSELGRGGMGRILEARDRVLERSVALKLLIDDEDAGLRHRFIDEARLTGQLQHPSVPSVYELGRLGDGRLFFAMKRIEGRTLRDILEELRDGQGDTARTYGRVRLLSVFSRVCRAIAFAHLRGVIHRDLKPDNIMLGEFGEVTVMDWGLAKPVDAPDQPTAAVAPARASGRFSTRAGEMTGTPQYMSPEQASGAEVGFASDIYSLGAMLYELLTLEPPFDAPSVRRIKEAVLTEPVIPPSRRAPARAVPHAIEELCLHCLQKVPEHRPASAAFLADQVDAFLEGEQDRARRASERDRRMSEGRTAADTFFARSEEHRRLQIKAASLRATTAPWAGAEARAALWAVEDEEAAARLGAARAFSDALSAYHAALASDPDFAPVRGALCELYYEAFLSAERDGDRVGMAHYENLLRSVDEKEAFADRLKGDGRLEIERLPRGVRAILYALQPVDRVLTRTHPRPLGVTPICLDPIPMGSYVIELEAPGLSPMAVPVHIGRKATSRVRLRPFPDAMRGAGFVHVAGGPGRFGGDPAAQLARPATVTEIDDFFLAKRPVTAGEYLEFLTDLARRRGVEVARAHAPRGESRGDPLWPFGPDGLPAIPEVDERGMAWRPDWAVVNVSAEDAQAYCAWLSDRTGERYRLPEEEEWEKAARGPDGRLFPWGDAFETAFCHMGISRFGPPTRGPIGAFPTDLSPYGVLDMAGGVSEWTASWLDGEHDPKRKGGQRVVKGGHWASGPTECRAASRFSQPVDQVLPTLGFRVARTPPG